MTQGRHGIGTTLIVIAVVVILAIATMAFVTLTSQSNTSTSSSTSPTSSTKCSGSRGSEVWNSSNPTPYEEHTPVLLMSPNTTGYVCVTYQTAWQGNQTLYDSDPAYSSSPFLVNGSYPVYPFTVASWQGCNLPTGGSSCRQIIYHSFQVSAVPTSIRPSGTMDYVTVIYTITAPGDSMGFYDESAPWTGCLGMPMAVGYPASQGERVGFHSGTTAGVPCPPLHPRRRIRHRHERDIPRPPSTLDPCHGHAELAGQLATIRT